MANGSVFGTDYPIERMSVFAISSLSHPPPPALEKGSDFFGGFGKFGSWLIPAKISVYGFSVGGGSLFKKDNGLLS